MRDQTVVLDVGDWVLADEDLVGVGGDCVLVPADLDLEFFEGLFMVFDIQTTVLFVLLIPAFGLIADSFKFFFLLFV